MCSDEYFCVYIKLMEFGFPLESKSHSTAQEFPRLSWHTKVHYIVEKSPLLVVILNQINQIYNAIFTTPAIDPKLK
jgi:hypothetical protein